jgi:hypothetical protein
MAICHRCKYYFVTWEKQTPHGCKAFGFKSLRLPALEVKLISKEDCHAFEDKFGNKTKEIISDPHRDTNHRP